MEAEMRRIAAAIVLAGTVVLAALLAGNARSSSPTKLTIWVGWSAGNELTSFKALAAEYDRAHPDVTVNVVGGITDDKIVAAIRSGNAPDVASSFNSYNVGNYCGSGGWIDLAPLMRKDHINASIFPPAPRYYTQYAGKRCALPLLADDYGLYYNKSMYAAHGIKSAPRTLSELAADAKKLTVRNKDGSLKVVGFDPFLGFYENTPERWIVGYGGKWTDAKGHAILAKDAAWSKWAKWQKSLIDWYGYKNLVKFQAGLGDEFSASNAFEAGKVAMNFDGEWRVSFIKHEAPKLNYGTAPMAVDDAHQNLYGAGYINGTIIGIPRGGHHLDQSWALVKYLTTNSHFLAQFSNDIRNVPTTTASLKSKEIVPDKHFATFLQIFGNPHSTTSPIMASGAAYTNLVGSFFEKWQAGQVGNLASGLSKLDSQLDAQVAQAKGGGNVP
jgi:multiple sugar transport system substrate-binding protein